jgi:hypothetical protein
MLRILRNIFMVLILLLLLVQLFIWTPFGQKIIVDAATSALEKQLGTRVEIGSVHLSFFRFIHLEEILVEDQEQDTLGYIGSLEIAIRKIQLGRKTTTINLGEVLVEDPRFYLKIPKGDTNTNLQFILDALSSESSDTSTKDFILRIEDFQLSNGRFYYDQYNEAPDTLGIDWSHIGFDSIYLHFANTSIINDSIASTFLSTKMKEQSGFNLTQLSGDVIFSNELTSLQNFSINTDSTSLSGSLSFVYDSVSEYGDFIDEVYMNTHFDTSRLFFADVGYFAPELLQMNQTYYLYGDVRGPVSNLNANNLYLAYGNQTFVNGNFSVQGLPVIESTFILARVKEVQTNYADLCSLKIPGEHQARTLPIPENIRNLGLVSFSGEFTGFYNDFVAFGVFNTAAGTVSTDIRLSNQETVLSYSGALQTDHFDLGKLLDNEELFGPTSANLKVTGSGFDSETISLEAQGSLDQFVLNKYDYHKASFDVTVEGKTINGNIQVLDSNLLLEAQGNIILSKVPEYNFQAQINGAKLHQLNLFERDSSATLSMEILVNLKGSNLDNLLGRAEIRSFDFTELEDRVQLEKVDAVALTSGRDKTIFLESENLTAQLTGSFESSEIETAVGFILRQWAPAIFEKYDHPPAQAQSLQLSINTTDYSGFSGIFIPAIEFKDTLNLYVKLNSADTTLIATLNSPLIDISGNVVQDITGDLDINADSFTLNIDARGLQMLGFENLENFTFQSEADTNLIATQTLWNNSAPNGLNEGTLNVDLKIKSADDFAFSINKSSISINDTAWSFKDSSFVALQGDEIKFGNFEISSLSERIFLDGYISQDSSKYLTLELDSFGLAHVNSFISDSMLLELHGVVDGNAKIQDVYHQIQFTSDLTFNHLRINDTELGDGRIENKWYASEKKLGFDMYFKKNELRNLSLKGEYYPQKTENQFNASLIFDEFPVGWIEPVVKDYINEIKGGLTGSLKIGGTLKKPELRGKMKLNSFSTNVLYLGQKFSINDEFITVEPDMISCDLITLQDTKGNKADVNFTLYHDNFDNMNFDIFMIVRDDIQVIKTTSRDNELFYGNISVAKNSTVGIDMDYFGDINLNLNAKPAAGTEVFVPIYFEENAEAKDYIYFTSALATEEEKKERFTLARKSDLKLNMDLELDENATIQLLMDQYSDDRIEARGKGNISMTSSEERGFEILGTYEITDGTYSFSFSNIINKIFTIKPNSFISWNGDPMNGQASITASYKLRTDLYDLGVTAAYDTSELRRRIPVEVLLFIDGNYMEPALNFGFVLPPKYAEIESLLEGLETGEKNKQVFSLLILNKFLPITGEGSTSGSGFVGANASEVLSNQLSKWLSQISNDVDIGVRYNPGDDISADEVEVALSTQLFNDRVLLETNVGLQSGNDPSQSSTNNNNGIVGEFTLYYKINEDGNVVGKVFNRSNDLNPIYQNQAPYTQGVGLSYTESFNTFSDLWCRIGNQFKKGDGKRDCYDLYIEREKLKQEKLNQKMQQRLKTK